MMETSTTTDVKSANLNDKLEETIYTRQDEGGSIYLNELPPAATATHQTLTPTASNRLHRLLRLQPSLNQRR
jgi:hypothetical protein